VLRKPFPDLMRELVLDPLGMSDSSFEQPSPSGAAAKVAMAHPWNGVQTPGGYHVYPEMAAAGLWTTAADLARLGVEVMRALRGDPSKLELSQETIAGMLRPQLQAKKIGQDFVGLGWFCAGNDKEFRFGHAGWNEGFLSEMRMFPALGKGAVVMINSIQGWFLRNELIDAIGREYRWPSSQNIPAAVPMTAGIAYAGLYRSDDGETVLVSQEAERLLIHFGQQGPLPLFQTIGDGFFARAISLRTQFNGPDPARPASLTIVHGGESTRFNRVDR
jgi:CubicO group peptidase (beta-lactamase class C family)